jgi:hypothetical protein
MTRATYPVTSEGQRSSAIRAIHERPLGSGFIVEVRERTRSLDQNALLWALLTAFERQATLNGQRLRADQWKAIMMHALNHPVDMLPTLDGKSWFAAGLRSSKLTLGEMSELLELVQSEAAQRGVLLEKV